MCSNEQQKTWSMWRNFARGIAREVAEEMDAIHREREVKTAVPQGFRLPVEGNGG